MREISQFTPQPAVGIDIGRHGIHVCFPQDGAPPGWKVIYFDFKTNPDWWVNLVKLIAPGASIAAEPTGWHYLAPVANVIQSHGQANLWLVSHTTTGRVRGYRISEQKTDENDARALAFIAQEISRGDPPRGTFLHDQHLENHVLALRIDVNAHRRQVKEATRLKNQLHAFAHSLFPALANSATWSWLVGQGAITPEEIHNLERPPGTTGQQWRYVLALREIIPHIPSAPGIRDQIIPIYNRLRQLNEEQANTAARIIDRIFEPPFDQVTIRWMTMPSPNPLEIAAIQVATHARAQDFDEDSFRAALGQFPQHRFSGATQRSSSTKKGYRPALDAVFNWTLRLVSPKVQPNPIRDHFAGGEKNGGRKFTAARGKLAKILLAVAKSADGYEERR